MSHPASSFVFLFLVLAVGLASASFNVMAIGKYFLAQAGSSIGISASVPPNPFNTLAQQLQDKETQLNSKEKDLTEREKSLSEKSQNPFAYITIGALSLLVFTHLYLDYKRNRDTVS